jgi:hypothetical protein
MKFVFNNFSPQDTIPVGDFLKNKKLSKYYNRETQAAMVTVGTLLKDYPIHEEMPLFYSTGIVEFEEFDLTKIAEVSTGADEKFSPADFVEKGMSVISPLTQFKVLYNMTLCFISIEYGFKGDNAALYCSAEGLLRNALYANKNEEIIIGAGKIYNDRRVESGFALVSKTEIQDLMQQIPEGEAISIFKKLQETWQG